MSAVWHVRENGAGPVFVLKQLRYPKGPGTAAARRFRKEIEVVTRIALKDSRIVPIVDADLEDAQPWFVMPKADGTARDEGHWYRGRCELVLEAGIQLCGILEYAHSQGVIHRDVKRENVLLFSGQVYLSDFGICFIVDDEDRVTRTAAQTLGSDNYVAPELLGGGPSSEVRPQVDVYSLGKTLYAMAAGDEPFPREYLRAPKFDLGKRFNDPRMEHLSGVIELMAAENPDERPATMEGAKQLLERALQNVKAGEAYRPGMYRESEQARARARTIAAELPLHLGQRRQDYVLDHIRGSRQLAYEAIAAEPLVMERPPSGRPALVAGGARALAESAGHWLAIGGPLVLDDDQQLLEELLASIRGVLRPRPEARRTIPGQGHAETAAGLALLALAALALHRRRFATLAHLLRAMSTLGGSWYHHDPLGNESTGFAALCTDGEVLRKLGTLLEIAPEDLRAAAVRVFGLHVLWTLRGLSPTELAEAAVAHDAILMEYSPGWFDDILVQWTDLLPAAMEGSRAITSGLAQTFRAGSAEELLVVVVGFMPALVRQAALVNRRSVSPAQPDLKNRLQSIKQSYASGA